MRTVRLVVKWGGIPVGFAIAVASVASTAKDIASWGLPIWLWYLIGLLVFSASAIAVMYGFWRDGRALKVRLDAIKKQTDPLLRAERRKDRVRFADRQEIPSILFRLFERTVELTEDAAKRNPLTDDDFNRLGKKLWSLGYLKPWSPFRRHAQYLSKFSNPLDIPTNPRAMRVLKLFNIEAEKFLFSVQGIMENENFGAKVLAEHDERSPAWLSRIRKLQIDLPSQINTKIDGHIISANSMANLVYFEAKSNPQSPGVQAMMPFLRQGMKSYVRGLNSDISSQISKFRQGEDEDIT